MHLSDIKNLDILNKEIETNHITCRIGVFGGRRYRFGKKNQPSYSLNQILYKAESLAKLEGASLEKLPNVLLGIRKLDEIGDTELNKAIKKNPILKFFTNLCRCFGGKFKKDKLDDLINDLEKPINSPKDNSKKTLNPSSLPTNPTPQSQPATKLEPKLEPKAQPQTATKPQPKLESTEQPQTATKPQPKLESTAQPQTATKRETKLEPTAQPQTATKQQPKLEPTAQPQTGTKLETKLEPKAQTQTATKPEPKLEPTAQPQIETKLEPKHEPKAQPQIGTKLEPKLESKAQTQTATKLEPKPEAKPEPKLEPKAEPTPLSKPIEPVKLVEKRVDQPTLDKVDIKATAKLNKKPGVEIEAFTPLNDEQVKTLLDQFPELRTMKAAQGRMTAYDSMMAMQKEGVPAILGEHTPANKELQQNIQFILYKANAEPSLKNRKELLLKAARGMEDCLPVTQGNLFMIRLELSTGSAIDNQVLLFILQMKERCVDQTIYELYPEMKNPDYAVKHHHTPYLQFPHIKTGFLHLVGEELGLNTAGALEDGKKNTQLHTKIAEFKTIFAKKFDIKEILKAFIQDINLRHGQINHKDLATWCPKNGFAYETFFDEDKKYPSYAEPTKDDFSVFLDEALALKIFLKLGLVEY